MSLLDDVAAALKAPIQAAIDAAFAGVANALAGIGNAISGAFGNVGAFLQSAIQGVADHVTDVVAGIKQLAVNIGGDVAAGFDFLRTQIRDVGNAAVTFAEDGVRTVAETLGSAVGDLTTATKAGSDALGTRLSGLVASVEDNIGSIAQDVSAGFVGLVTGIHETIASLSGDLTGGLTALGTSLGTLITDGMLDAVERLWTGLFDGLIPVDAIQRITRDMQLIAGGS